MNTERAIELQEQAWNFQSEGKLEAALLACREALRLIEQSEGPDSPDVVNLLNDLAEIESERQNFREALALAQRAQAIADALYQTVQGDTLGDCFTGETAARIQLRTLGLLGAIRRTLGDYTRAEADLQRALEAAVAEFGAASPETAQARNNLGVLYKQLGRFDEGLQLYNQSLRSIGEESLESSVVYHNIGGILHAQGNFAAAEEAARKAWEISRRLAGEDDPRTMLDAVAYAAILEGLQRYDESESIYRRALAIFEKAHGPQHYEVAATLHNLGALLAARGHCQEAEQHYRRALAIKEKLLGVGSLDAALTRNNLGALLNLTGRPREAAVLLESAMEILQDQLAPDHPHLALARANLKRALLSSR